MQQLVLSAIGPDRAGIVDALTGSLREHRANIADSRMVNLRGQFAIVMLIETPEDEAAAVQQALTRAAEQAGLTATLRTAAGQKVADPAVPYRIRAYAMDQVGLVHRVTHALHLLRVNIEEMSTRLEHGAHTGTPLFSMDMIVSIPTDVPLKKVRDELDELGSQLNCDLEIEKPHAGE